MNFADKFGRTPMHYAALTDCRLIENVTGDTGLKIKLKRHKSSRDIFGTTPGQLKELRKKYEAGVSERFETRSSSEKIVSATFY